MRSSSHVLLTFGLAFSLVAAPVAALADPPAATDAADDAATTTEVADEKDDGPAVEIEAETLADEKDVEAEPVAESLDAADTPEAESTDDAADTTSSITPNSTLKPYAYTKNIGTLGGATRYETSALQALDGWKSSEWVIVASGESYADSICASGLAGALECPIVLTQKGSIPDVIKNAIIKLGCKHAIVLGGKSVVADSVVKQLKSLTGNDVTRLGGDTRMDTQMTVYEFGRTNDLWGTDTAIVAYGWNFADALSISPLAYKLKAPIFYVDSDCKLPSAQKKAISAASFKKFLVVGGNAVVKQSVEDWLDEKGTVKRLSGDTRYETSVAIARYAVSKCGMAWDGMAFTSGQSPYDALGGGALQGSRNTVLVLKNEGDSTGACMLSGVDPKYYRYFGGSAVYSDAFKVLMTLKSGYDVAQIEGVDCQVDGCWCTIDGKKYYWNWQGKDWVRGWGVYGHWFDPNTGVMATGWVNVDGTYFDFGSDGNWVKTHYHNIEWAGQPNGYYCGPTSGYMVLRNVGAWTSASGDSLSIYNVAQYMHTDNYGYTSFQDRWFSRGMNNWLGRDVYTSVHTPSYETVRDAVMASYVNGYATVVDEQERRGGPHCNGHSNTTFAHLMVVDGYNQETDAVYIVDPGSTLWSSASDKFWYGSLKDFVETYMQTELDGARERIGVHYAKY